MVIGMTLNDLIGNKTMQTINQSSWTWAGAWPAGAFNNSLS